MAGERILVIDDSKYMVSFLADTALPTIGYKPMVATTGHRGLELVSKEKPDLILLDLNLPDMTGMDVLHNLAASGNQTPVILMTAYGSEQVVVEAFRLGVRDYLSKPVELDDLAGALERALYEPRLQRDKRQLAEELHRTNLELRRQVQQVTTFTGIGHAITSSLDLEQILTRVIDAAVRLCQSEEATIWLLEGTRRDLIMVAEKGVDPSATQMANLTRIRVQDALAGEAVRTRKPVVRRASQETGVKIKTGYMVKSVMYVPMMIQEECLGVVSVANRISSRSFHRSDLLNLQILADYAAIAIENARLYKSTDDSLQKRLVELAAITDITEAVITLDPNIFLRRAVNRIHQTFHVQATALFLTYGEQRVMRFALGSNVNSRALARLHVPFGKGLVGHCAKDVRAYFTNEPHSHPLFMPQVDAAIGVEAQSVMVVPLALKERVIGVIELVNKRPAPFDEHDVSLLRAIATPVAAAVDNARLFYQITRERATLRAVLEGSVNPIMIVSQAGRMLLCNPAARALFNIPADGSVGRPIEDATGLAYLAKLVARGQAVTEEIEVADRTYLTSVAPISGVGSAVEMQEITYLKQLDKAKSEFVTAVSHDLRSPLTAVSGFVELLPVSGPLTDRQQHFVSQALASAKLMRQLIDDLLDLARIEAGLGPADTPCSLYDIAQDVVADLRTLATSKNLELALFKRGEIPAVLGHADQLQRAVSNLVNNAIKYTPPGGQVRVGLQAVDKRLYLAVLDTGRGIPEADLPHIFERFYRSEDHRDTEGSGLGLTMVKSIIEAHGGTVSVRSQVGKGSTFTVALPLA